MNIRDLLFVKGGYLSKLHCAVDASCTYDASKIQGTPINNAGKADKKVLTYDEETDKIVWGTAFGGTREVLTVADSGRTLSATPDYYFVDLPYI